ncbi:tripartite tricarboxylate transporter substrate binding protein [Comamonadaceae bacterium OH2310_COT-174]|nr:tripartite tricarboxylate transporter substrate binding protein [Comamonadaceae bacterium OH2310_COT-174]
MPFFHKLLSLPLCFAAISCWAQASAGYGQHPPSAQITGPAAELVVPWPPGGGTDSVARAFVQLATPFAQQPPAVVNRPGASGAIGFQYALTPSPNSKLAMVSAEILLLPLQGIGQVQLGQFEPIAQLTNDPLAITVRADAPWQSIEEWLASAQSAPGLTISTAGVGTTHHMAVTSLAQATGAQLINVPYQGTAPAVMGVLSGEVHATIAAYAELAHFVEAGKLRTLTVLAKERLPAIVQVPTLRERGHDLQWSVWRGLALPKGSAPELVQAWQDVAHRIATSPQFASTLKGLSITPAYLDRKAFSARLQAEEQAYRALLPHLKQSQ